MSTGFVPDVAKGSGKEKRGIRVIWFRHFTGGGGGCRDEEGGFDEVLVGGRL